MKALLALALMVALLAIGKSVHADNLHDAARAGDVASNQRMLKAGANVNVEDGLGYTALYRAAFKGHVAAIEVLLKAGANVNAKAPKARGTALHVAADKGHVAAVEVLLKAGANVNAKNKGGVTALFLATFRRNSREGSIKSYREIIRLLREAGAR